MSFTFNSIDFTNLGVIVLSGWEPRTATNRPVKGYGLPASDKIWYQQELAEPIEVVFPVRIQGSNLKTTLDAVNAALATDDDVALSFWYTDRQWLARWDGVALKCKPLNSTTVLTEIRFLAQPNMIATSASPSSVAITTNPQTVYIPGPLVGDGVVAGNAPVGPVITLQNTGTVIAASVFQLWNYTTGDYLDYTDAIENGVYVKFDCDARRLYVSTDGTNWTEQTGKVTTNWLTILGGAAARMTVIGVTTTATLSWTYSGRYM